MKSGSRGAVREEGARDSQESRMWAGSDTSRRKDLVDIDIAEMSVRFKAPSKKTGHDEMILDRVRKPPSIVGTNPLNQNTNFATTLTCVA